MRKRRRSVARALVLTGLLLAAFPIAARAQELTPLQKITANGYRKRLDTYKTQLLHYSSQANIEWTLLIVITVLGGTTTIVQGVNRPWTKVCVALIGLTVATLTVVNDGFDADRKTLGKIVSDGNQLIAESEAVLDSLEPQSVQVAPGSVEEASIRSFQQGQLDIVLQKIKQLEALRPLRSDSNSRTLLSVDLEPTVLAETRRPAWVQSPPQDKSSNFYVGQATASSVEEAKEASYKNAIDNAVKSVATAAPVDFFAYMKAISSVADTYLSYDPKTFMVTFWTLLRAPKDLVAKQTVEQLANYEDYIAAFRRGVKASQARDWASSIQAMQTAIRQQPQTQLVKQVSIQGVRSEPYAPHYFLGIGLTELHECAAAADAFARAEVEVKGTPLVGPLQAQKGRCPAR